MIIFIPPLLKPHSVSFNGGSGMSFLRATGPIAKEMLVYVPFQGNFGLKPVPAFRLPNRNLYNLLTKFHQKYGYAKSSGNYLIFRHPYFDLLHIINGEPYNQLVTGTPRLGRGASPINGAKQVWEPLKWSPLTGISYLKVVNNKVFTLPNYPAKFTVRDLKQLPWPKKLHIDPFIRRQIVDLVSPGTRITVFLQEIAEATGANFTETPHSYSLTFSPTKFRKRIVATIQDFLSDKANYSGPINQAEKMHSEITLDEYQTISDKKLTEMYVLGKKLVITPSFDGWQTILSQFHKEDYLTELKNKHDKFTGIEAKRELKMIDPILPPLFYMNNHSLLSIAYQGYHKEIIFSWN